MVDNKTINKAHTLLEKLEAVLATIDGDTHTDVTHFRECCDSIRTELIECVNALA